MEQALAKQEQEIDVGFNLKPRNLTEAMEYAKLLANSSIVPKQFAGKPGDVLVAVQMGHELGLSPIQALRNIAVINGRATIWGDALLAIVLKSPLCDYVKEQTLDAIKAAGKATCKVRRKNQEEAVSEFSIDNAKLAGLWGKPGPWTQYPERMLQMRARAFALRDVFPDVLCGMDVREEIEDIRDADANVAIPTPHRREEPVKVGAVDAFVREAQGTPVAQPSSPVPVAAGAQTQSAPESGNFVWTGNLAGVFQNQSKKGPWYAIKTNDGGEFTTFDKGHADLAARLDADKSPVRIEWKANGKYRNVVSIVAMPEDRPTAVEAGAQW